MLSTLGGALAIPAANGRSRISFRGRQVVLVGLLAVQMISPLVVLVPHYRWMNALDLLNRDIANNPASGRSGCRKRSGC